MPKPTIRSSQLISPFGVGSLCEIDGQSFFIRGVGSWRKGFNLQKVETGSLTRLLHPKDLKKPTISASVLRFPRWHFCTKCRELKKWTREQDEKLSTDGVLPVPRCGNRDCRNTRLVPMRFVAICKNGHLDEIDWYWWAHRRSSLAKDGRCSRITSKLKFTVTGKGGGDFSSMNIECNCGANSDLEGIQEGVLPQTCRGYQPGEQPQECRDPQNGNPSQMYMEPRGSSALHFPIILSALDIDGDSSPSGYEELRSHETYKTVLKMAKAMLEHSDDTEQVIDIAKGNLSSCAEDLDLDFNEAILCFKEDLLSTQSEKPEVTAESIVSQGEIFEKEFPVLANPDEQNSRFLITRPDKPTDRFKLDSLIERYTKVERLREIRAFRGFKRKEDAEDSTLVSPSLDRPYPKWLPATMVLGEGVFIRFKDSAIAEWRKINESSIEKYTKSQLITAEVQGLPYRRGFNANATFIMLHTFAHLLLNQLSFDCGYSSTSLRERIYCGTDSNPYAGVLIYTADSDSEGSMGGLSEMGSPDKIEEVIYRSVSRGQWCSSDPVCRELDSQGMDGLNRAACHACSLVAETSCNFSNILLNRVLISGDGRNNSQGSLEPVGYFRSLLED